MPLPHLLKISDGIFSAHGHLWHLLFWGSTGLKLRDIRSLHLMSLPGDSPMSKVLNRGYTFIGRYLPCTLGLHSRKQLLK